MRKNTVFIDGQKDTCVKLKNKRVMVCNSKTVENAAIIRVVGLYDTKTCSVRHTSKEFGNKFLEQNGICVTDEVLESINKAIYAYLTIKKKTSRSTKF